jgi:hypothetical protein
VRVTRTRNVFPQWGTWRARAAVESNTIGEIPTILSIAAEMINF